MFANSLVKGVAGTPWLDPRIVIEKGATELRGSGAEGVVGTGTGGL